MWCLMVLGSNLSEPSWISYLEVRLALDALNTVT